MSDSVQIDSATNKPVIQLSTGQAAHVTSGPSTIIRYSDATYAYYCEAAPGTARSTAAWQVLRKNNATEDMVFAGTGKFEHVATDLAAVSALTYTLGA